MGFCRCRHERPVENILQIYDKYDIFVAIEIGDTNQSYDHVSLEKRNSNHTLINRNNVQYMYEDKCSCRRVIGYDEDDDEYMNSVNYGCHHPSKS